MSATSGKIVLVCGGRHFEHRDAVYAMLDTLHDQEEIVRVIQGGATGADEFARDWADNMQIDCLTFEADWERYGAAAGPIRNAVMLKKGHPNLVLAFPGGPGTADMVRRAKAGGFPVVEVRMANSDPDVIDVINRGEIQ